MENGAVWAGLQELGAGKDRAPCPALSPPGEGAIRIKQCYPACREQLKPPVCVPPQQTQPRRRGAGWMCFP